VTDTLERHKAASLHESSLEALHGLSIAESLRVLIINADLPQFPGRAGHEYLNTTSLARIVKRVGLVSLIHTREQEASTRNLEAAGVELHLWRSHAKYTDNAPPRASLPRRVLRRSLRYALPAVRALDFRPSDVYIQDYQFRNLAPHVLEAIGRNQWHALVVIQSASACWFDYVPRFPATALVMHDVRSVLYWRRARAASSARDRLKYRLEALRYFGYERKYCKEVDVVVTVSAKDEAWVRKYYRPKRAVTVPIPVDSAYFTPDPANACKENLIVFTGTMDHPPNVDAATFFAHSVLPHVQDAVPNAEFWVVGRDPTPQVQALAALPGVVVTGFVPDIRAYLRKAAVIVAPIRYGSGMRNKILEAWATQKCVVSTSVGAEGLLYEDRKNILIRTRRVEKTEKSLDTPRRGGRFG